ncbi:DUF4214 domain-containing protein [Massilia sp. METH4]|uniref:DUF4214 domain-containing protein n=1 Tax=Massilia sp. METH4 TaxID=3123041 RepID=UPI0030D3D946
MSSVTTKFDAVVSLAHKFLRPQLPYEVPGHNWDPFYSMIATAADILEVDQSRRDEWVNYTTRVLRPSVTGSYDITVTDSDDLYIATYWGLEKDSQLWLYDTTFDPENPLVNIIAFNEQIDHEGYIYGSINWLSHLPGMQLIGGHTYVAVISTYDPETVGTAYLEIVGPGAVQVTVPGEPDDTEPMMGTVGVPVAQTYGVGDELAFTVGLDEVVMVDTAGGTPTLAVTIGSQTVQAQYVGGSGSATLTFRLVVDAGHGDVNGIAVTALALNGGTIRDAAGNDADLTLRGVGDTSAVLVDAVAPVVQAIAVAQVTQASVSYTVTLSESATGIDADDFTVTSTGSAAGRVASVTAVDSSTWTVTVGGLSGDGTLRLDLKDAGTGIADLGGNAITAGFTAGQAQAIDRLAPAVTAVTAPTPGTYKAGELLDFTVTLDEAVIVDTAYGIPRLALAIGGQTVHANYWSGSGPTELVFLYVVAPGDAGAVAVGALTAGGATLKDTAGNDATLSLAAHLPPLEGVAVDARGPKVSGPVAVPSAGTYTIGQHLDFTITFDEDIAVSGDGGTLGLVIGATLREAKLVAATANSLTYRYVVQAGDADASGIILGELDVYNASIRDLDGNDAILALAGHQPALAGVLVDGSAPDTGAPDFLTAAVLGRTLVMTYGDAGQLDAGQVPAPGAFTVKVNGAELGVTSVAVDAAARTVTLTLETAVLHQQAVTVAYTDPTSGDDARAIQDGAGNDAATLAAAPVFNATPPFEQVYGYTTLTDGVLVHIDTGPNGAAPRHVLTIPIVVPEREERIGAIDAADISLADDGNLVSLLTAQVPVGFGLKSSGTATLRPAALADLVEAIRAHTADGSADQARLTGAGSAFIGTLDGDAPLLVRTIVPIAAANAVPSELRIVGGYGFGHVPKAVVVDARALPAGSTIALDDVEFAVVVGAVRIVGNGATRLVWGDASAQQITLGERDDVLHGGAGDDILRSAGSSDHVFGEEGNDIVYGGTGNDTLDGGSGADIALMTGAGRADYSLRVVDGALMATHRDGGIDGIDVLADVETLRFLRGDTSVAGSVARVFEALTGARAGVATVDALAATVAAGASLKQLAGVLYAQDDAGATLDDTAFVAQLYHRVLDRAADEGGLQFWGDRLADGATRGEVALALADSPEKLAMPADVAFGATDVATLVRLYSALFDRAPDEGGLNWWIGVHGAGNSMAGIADAFVAGTEGSGWYGALDDAEFTAALYRTALHREAGAGEAQYWTDLLANGALDRGDVALAFADSPEKMALIGTMSTTLETLYG